MAYDLIPILILLGCMVALAAIVVRKLPQLKTLDVETLPAELERRLKQRLLTRRLQRHVESLGRMASTVLRPLVVRLLQLLKRWYRRVLELEAKYRKPATPQKTVPLLFGSQALLAAATELRAGNDLRAAEEKLVQVIGIDPRNVSAYEALGEIYLALRDWAKARDVYQYLSKLLRRTKALGNGTAHRLASCYLNLAVTHQELGHQAQALQYARKAVAVEPTNPRVLDFQLKISILLKDKALALTTWEALRQADPENAKLPELRQQIDELG